MIRPYNRALGAKGKQANRAFGPWKYTPIPAFGGTSTRRGKSALHFPFISYVMNSITTISRLPRSADKKEGLLLGRLEANFG